MIPNSIISHIIYRRINQGSDKVPLSKTQLEKKVQNPTNLRLVPAWKQGPRKLAQLLLDLEWPSISSLPFPIVWLAARARIPSCS